MTYNRILKWSRRASHAVSRPTTGTHAVQRVASTSGVCVNRALAHTATSKCLTAGSFSLKKCQWKALSGIFGYLRVNQRG